MFDCVGLAPRALKNYSVEKLSQPQHESSLIWLLAGGTIICQHFTWWEVSSTMPSCNRESWLSCTTQLVQLRGQISIASVQSCPHKVHWSLRIPWPRSNACPAAGMALHRTCLGGDAPRCPFPSKRQCNHIVSPAGMHNRLQNMTFNLMLKPFRWTARLKLAEFRIMFLIKQKIASI